MTTTAEQLAALEGTLKQIDPNGYLRSGAYGPIVEEGELAIREQQAREWIVAWCEKNAAEAKPWWSPHQTIKYGVRVWYKGTTERAAVGFGNSWPEALAATIKKLTAGGS